MHHLHLGILDWIGISGLAVFFIGVTWMVISDDRLHALDVGTLWRQCTTCGKGFQVDYSDPESHAKAMNTVKCPKCEAL